ncbi:hypothetical protein [Leucobacter salsicius]|uniref:hypothetical protein n=1 Tax=Leucobacter salsicius TaxID=664638 RepID=UPI00034779E8|nr:hypothetical protein [Leucobacter salsicius]
MLTLLSFLAPYAIALINHPSWPARWKRTIAIAVSLLLTLIVLGFYYWQTGDVMPQWPVLILLGLVVSQAAFTLLWPSTKRVEAKHGAR